MSFNPPLVNEYIIPNYFLGNKRYHTIMPTNKILIKQLKIIGICIKLNPYMNPANSPNIHRNKVPSATPLECPSSMDFLDCGAPDRANASE